MIIVWWLFNEHNVLPGEYYAKPEGEKLLLRAFYTLTMEKRRDDAWLGT